MFGELPVMLLMALAAGLVMVLVFLIAKGIEPAPQQHRLGPTHAELFAAQGFVQRS